MKTITEWTAIVLLSMGVIKMLVGIISPRTLLDKNPVAKLYANNRKARLGLIMTMALFMIYVSFSSNLSVAQWFVAGYTMLIIFVGFLFFSDEVVKTIVACFSKIPKSKFRILCLVIVSFELLALYSIWF